MKKLFPLIIAAILLFSGANMMNAIEGKPLKITIVFDNYLYKEGLKTKWGFACMVEGMEKTILFDTGASADILLHNIKQLNLDPKAVEAVVISHNHYDHVGGLSNFLEINPNVSVYMPASAAQQWEPEIKKRKAQLVSVDQPAQVCKNVFLSGEIQGPVNEQALILDTAQGLVVITGCAHPDIVKIVEKTKTLHNKNIYMVFGGFHLVRKSEAEVKQIIKRFREMGVLKAGPTHCTGDEPIRLFKEAFAENFIKIGVGKVITISN